MIDYLLKFPSKEAAEQFGLANGFASIDEDGVIQSSLASHTHALHVIGEHFIPQPDINDEPQPAIGDGQYWVLFRDLVGIPVPEGAEQFIYLASPFILDDKEENFVPAPRLISEDVPSVFWA